jgi:hypothetical protein
MSAPCIGRTYNDTENVCSATDKGTFLHIPAHFKWSPLPTITEKDGRLWIGMFRKEAILGWIMLRELPVSTRTDKSWPWMWALNRRVLGEGWPETVCSDRWNCSVGFAVGVSDWVTKGEGIGGGVSLIRNSSSEGCSEVGSGGSSWESNIKNCLFLHQCPLWNFYHN